MKKFYTLKLFLTVLFAAVFGTMSADVSSNFTDEKLTVGSGELGWTASIAAQQWDSQYDRGVQFGSSKNPAGVFTLTAGQSLTQVTSVSITASASGAGNTLSVNVGGVEFTGDVTEIASGTKNANQVYTFTGPATDGVITITIDDNTKAVWVKSIAVACTETSVDGGGDTPEPPVGGDVTFFSETFADGQGDFTIDNVQEPAGGGYVWNHDSSFGYMKASCYIGGQALAAESWLISPAIDLTKATEATLSFTHAANKFGGTVSDALSVQVREQGGEWTKLDVSEWPAGNSWTWVDATADLSAYVGKTIEIAFVYTSQDGDAGTWEVKNVSVEGQGEAGEQPEPPVEEGVIFSETFAADQGDFTIDNVTMPEELSYVWNNDDRYACIKASAYVNETNYAAESWLISPEIDLTAQTGTVTLSFEQACNFFKGTLADAVSVQVREQGGEWTKLDVTGWPESDSWTFVDATADLSAYAGKTIQIAFVYTSTADVAGTWEVRNVVIRGEEGGDEPVGPEPPVADVVFNFNANAWGLPVSDSNNPTQGNITAPITQDGVTLTAEGGSTAPRMYLNFTTQLPQLRVYKGATVTLTAPEGKMFTAITWYDGSDKFSATANCGTWDDATYTWTGESETVTFTIAGTSNTNFIGINLADSTVGIDGVTADAANAPVDVYSIDGRLLRTGVQRSQAANGLPAGLYIIGGQKVIVK